MTGRASIDAFGDVSAPCGRLARRDPAMRRALAAIGAPVIRRRPGGFEGLFRIIVEQQVSVPSAQAVWGRCTHALGAPDPADVLHAGEAGLCDLGLSRPKARYVVELARRIEAGSFDVAAVAGLDDDEASRTLQGLVGVGPWTAAIYLLFCEGRIDIWPPGDVALQHAWGAAAGLGGKAPAAALESASADWAPLRGLAAHILWTYYAHLRGRSPI